MSQSPTAGPASEVPVLADVAAICRHAREAFRDGTLGDAQQSFGLSAELQGMIDVSTAEAGALLLPLREAADAIAQDGRDDARPALHEALDRAHRAFIRACRGATGNETDSPTGRGTSGTPSVSVRVFYLDAHGNLVARSVRIDARGDRGETTLAVGAVAPQEAGLSNAYPPDVFTSWSLDGYGAHGSISVGLEDRALEGPQQGMTPVQARMAIRAAACTAHLGSPYPVTFYVGRKPATTVLGVPLDDGAVTQPHCPR